MFHAPMGRFQLDQNFELPLFSVFAFVPFNCVHSCIPHAARLAEKHSTGNWNSVECRSTNSKQWGLNRWGRNNVLTARLTVRLFTPVFLTCRPEIAAQLVIVTWNYQVYRFISKSRVCCTCIKHHISVLFPSFKYLIHKTISLVSAKTFRRTIIFAIFQRLVIGCSSCDFGYLDRGMEEWQGTSFQCSVSDCLGNYCFKCNRSFSTWV